MAPPPTLSELFTGDYLKVKLVVVVGVAVCQELVKLIIKEIRGRCSSTPTLRIMASKEEPLTLSFTCQAAAKDTVKNEVLDLAVKSSLEAEEARARAAAEKKATSWICPLLLLIRAFSVAKVDAGAAEKEATEAAEMENTGAAEKEDTGAAEMENTGSAEKDDAGAAEKENAGAAGMENAGA